MKCYVDVAVSGATFKFDRLYTYSVPEYLEPFALPGARVVVPFGTGKPRMGLILAVAEQKDNLKQILDIERTHPLVNDELIQLIFLLKQLTLCTYDDALRTIIPKYSRLVADINGDEVRMKPVSRAHQEKVYVRNEQPEYTGRITEKQQQALDILVSPLTFAEIQSICPISRNILAALLEKNLISTDYREKVAEIYVNYQLQNEVTLTPPQQLAYSQIKGYMDDSQKNTTLLFGITSSGKTLIYFQLIKDVIQQGKTALLLVPEIALATQLIIRLKGWLGNSVGVIHSRLTDTERQLEWSRIRNGECSLVVGTRSSVFVPLENIGLIIIDEEQEQTYISDSSPRYDTFSIASDRANYHSAHLLLSSATPSVESYHYAKIGRYNYVELKNRYMDMPLPEVTVVDMRNELLEGNTLTISEYLKDEIELRLAKKEQVILLLNRRGYRTVSICSNCKEIVTCSSCDVAMVYHKYTDRHICHYCAKSQEAILLCEKCGGEIRHTGIGTQKIEEELNMLFPSARIARVDYDAITKRHTLESVLTEFAKGEIDIIIGTQMVSKGLDFVDVTLVGVLCIDQMMLMTNFRATERAFSLLTQVIGRSGRGSKIGQAVIQTIDPKNRIISLATSSDFEGFYEREILSRKAHLYPPYCSVSSAMILGKDQKKTEQAAYHFLSLLKTRLAQHEKKLPIRILGPVATRVSYVSDTFRYKVTFKSRGDEDFRSVVNNALVDFYQSKDIKDIHVNVSFYDDGDI
ncbi:MAG: primosomal protein N' [Oscillospiraceae bacterium]|nr:primosomal protein N' [Oscillospiraceae bacterium]